MLPHRRRIARLLESWENFRAARIGEVVVDRAEREVVTIQETIGQPPIMLARDAGHPRAADDAHPGIDAIPIRDERELSP